MIKEWVVLIGPPGSGKGTLGQWLAQQKNYVHFSTGWILQHALTDHKLKARLAPIWKSGRLINDQMMTEILFHFVKRQRSQRILFDGYPRNLIQHRFLEAKMALFNISVLKVIIFDVDLNLCEERIQNRLICPTCQRVYHTFFLPPKRAGICDYHPVTLQKRFDDHKLAKRFAVFKAQTEPLQNWYLEQQATHSKLKVFVVNGRYDPATIQTQVQTFLTTTND